MDEAIKTNSLKAWFLAARPKTLAAAAVPVMIGIAFAFRDTIRFAQTTIIVEPDVVMTGVQGQEFYLTGEFRWIPAILCLLFAWIMQIDSNFVNDYFDCLHGNDGKDRFGPKRACSEGWITMKAMRWGIGITTLLGCITGLPLVFYGGYKLIWVGLLCVIFCFLYTTKLSYMGLGDVLVVLFFGIVPVCCTYYVLMPEPININADSVPAAALACGLIVDTLLVLNNYRDREQDKESGKITLVVRLGEKKTKWFYQHLGFFGIAIMAVVNFNELSQLNVIIPIYLIYIIYGVMHFQTYRAMFRINKGRGLNKVLGMTARNIFAFGILSVIDILSILMFN